MNPKFIKLSLVLFFISFIIRLPLIGTNFWKTPDAVEYLNIAQHLVQGKGLTTSLKIHFFNSEPVIHSALSERPIGFPLFLGFLLRIKNSPLFLQTTLLALNSINALLIFFLFKKFLPFPWAFLGALLFALNPNILITNRLLMPEPLYLFLILLSLIFFYQPLTNKTIVLSGFSLGLSYLVRPETLFLLLGLSISLAVSKKYHFLPFLFISFLTIAFPYHLINYQLNHQLMSVMELNAYRAKSFFTGMKNFNPQLVTIPTFIISNSSFIIRRQLQLLVGHLKSLISFPWLGLLFPLAFFPSLKFIRQTIPLAIFGSLSFILIIATWAIIAEPERMLLIPFIFMLLYSLKVLSKIKSPKIAFLIIFITLSSYLAYDLHRLYWARVKDVPAQNFPHNQQLISWLKTHTQSTDIIASPDPWLISLTTSQPSIMLPQNLNANNIDEFINTYQINYIISSQNPLWQNSRFSTLFTTDPPSFSVYQILQHKY
jgi:hypothetical protein